MKPTPNCFDGNLCTDIVSYGQCTHSSTLHAHTSNRVFYPHRQSFKKVLVYESCPIWHKLCMKHEYVSVSVLWNIFVVHELWTVLYTYTIVHDNHVLICICVNKYHYDSMVPLHVVCYMKNRKSNRKCFMIAICAHVLTIISIVLHSSTLHAQARTWLFYSYRHI
jgi:hypothetical protein